jgi:hypothetical protein
LPIFYTGWFIVNLLVLIAPLFVKEAKRSGEKTGFFSLERRDVSSFLVTSFHEKKTENWKRSAISG